MLNSTDRFYHRVYDALKPRLSVAIDIAFASLCDSLSEETYGRVTTMGDDRAEVCVAAVCRYLVECNPDDPDVKAAVEAAGHKDEA